MKSIAAELATRSGHDFQGYFARVLGELVDGSAETKRLGELATARLSSWAENRRAELFEFYKDRMEIVRHIGGAPFNGDSHDPDSFLMKRLVSFFEGIAENQTGKYRNAPKFLVTSEF